MKSLTELSQLNELDHATMSRAANLMNILKTSQFANKLTSIVAPAAKYYLITTFAEMLGIPKSSFHSTIKLLSKIFCFRIFKYNLL